MDTSKSGIYVDGYELRRILKKAQFSMTKADRIIYGTPVLQECGEFLKNFVMAYDFKDEKLKYIRKMCASFEVLKLDLRIILQDNIIRSPGPHSSEMSPKEFKIKILEYIARIEKGVNKWKNSVIAEEKKNSNS